MKPKHNQKTKAYICILIVSILCIVRIYGQDSPVIKFQIGHSQHINSISWSPDGKFIATGAEDATIKIWNPATGMAISTLKGHKAGIISLSWSSNSKYIVSTAGDKLVIIWDPEQKKQIKTYQFYDKINSLKWCPKGNFIACGMENHSVKILEIAPENDIQGYSSSIERFTLNGHEKEIESIDWSPDGKYVASLDNKGVILIWDAYQGKLVHSFNKEGDMATELIWTNNGKYIITGEPMRYRSGKENTISSFFLGKKVTSKIKIRDANTGILKNEIHLKNGISSLSDSPDGKLLAIREILDETLYIFNIETGKIEHELSGNSFTGKGLDWSPDGHFVTTDGSPGILNIWNIHNHKLFKKFVKLSSPIHVSWSPEGEFITYSNYASTKFWNNKTLRLTQDIKDLKKVCWGKNDSIFAGYKERYKDSVQTLCLYKKHYGNYFPAWELPIPHIISFEMSPQGKYLAVVSIQSDSSIISIFETQKGQRISSWVASPFKITAIAWNPYGTEIVSATNLDNTAKILKDGKINIYFTNDRDILTVWNVRSGKKIKILQKGFNPVTSSNSTSDGKTEGDLTLSGHKKNINEISWNPNGKYILSAGNDGYLKLWDYDKGSLYREYRSDGVAPGFEIFHKSSGLQPINSVKWSPDGMQFATACNDYSIRVWDINKGIETQLSGIKGVISPIKAVKHQGIVNKVFWAPNGKRLISASEDNTIKIWKVEHTLINELDLVSIWEENEYVAFTSDGYYTASHEGVNIVHYEYEGESYPFSQFDIQYNRPDVLLKRLDPTNNKMITIFSNCYKKRLSKLGFSQTSIDNFANLNFQREFNAPEVQLTDKKYFQQTNEKTYQLKCSVYDEKYKIWKLNVWVNGIPINGSEGINLSTQNNSTINDIEILINLSNGNNIIEVSAQNIRGIESLKERFQVEYIGVSKKPELFFVGIGNDTYRYANSKNNFNNLDYPEKDVKDVLHAIQNNSQTIVKTEDTLIINEIINKKILEQLKFKLQKTTENDIVIIFFNGHGILTDNLEYFLCTYNTQPETPEKESIKFEDLELLLDNIPARKKLLLIDACYSGESDFQQAEFELMKEMFRDFRRDTGAWIVSSSGRGTSLEGWFDNNKKIENGVFSYTITKAFKKSDGKFANADHNKNGLQISELKDYIIKEVNEITFGRQKPTVRRENYEFDFTF